MLDRLNQVSCAADLPDFVTLTLPDDCFEDNVSKAADTAKLLLSTLFKRIHRACPSASGFWRIEWKARKSGLHMGKLFPHFHLLLWGLPQRSILGFDEKERWESFVPVRDAQLQFAGLSEELLKSHVFDSPGQGSRFVNRHILNRSRFEDAEFITAKRGVEHTFMTFFDWVSAAWYHVVGTGNVSHFFAGCRVEKIRTWGGVLSYCAKYMSKADSENFLSDVPTGRNWGIFNRAFMPWAKMIDLPLDDHAGVRIRRVMRRYLEHKTGRRVQRHFGMTLYCDPTQFLRVLAREPDSPF